MEEQKIITQFIKNRIASGLAETTIQSYCYALKEFWQWLVKSDVNMVNSDTIENYFVYLRGRLYKGKKLSKTSIKDKYSVLHAYYEYAVQQGYYAESPIKIKKPKADSDKIKVFSEEQISTMLSYLSDCSSFSKLRDRAIVCTLLSTGVRRSELLAISDVSGNSIVILGKGNKKRVVPISASLKAVLKTYIIERNKIASCPNLTITNRGTAMTKNGLRAVFTRLSCQLGFAIHTHMFRHTYATLALSNNLPIHNLQYYLGHSSLTTTQIYLHHVDSADEIANRTNPLNNFKIFL